MSISRWNSPAQPRSAPEPDAAEEYVRELADRIDEIRLHGMELATARPQPLSSDSEHTPNSGRPRSSGFTHRLLGGIRLHPPITLTFRP